MKRYFVEEVKCGTSEGGFACGPVSGSIITTIKYREDNAEPEWLTLVEFDGFPNFYQTEKDCHDAFVAEDFEDQEFSEYAQDHEIGDFNDIWLGSEYEEVFDSLKNDPKNPAVPLIRYLVALTRCFPDGEYDLIKLGTGKYMDEVNVPLSEDEQLWLEELEGEDE